LGTLQRQAPAVFAFRSRSSSAAEHAVVIEQVPSAKPNRCFASIAFVWRLIGRLGQEY